MTSGSSRGLLVVCAIIVHIGCDEAQVSLPFQCSFESDDLCGMTQRADDQFDWTRHTGPTPSRKQGQNTGPDRAKNGDYYIYIEASDHRDGEAAIIETPPISFSGDMCLQFWYHMYTRNEHHMGRLAVFTSSQVASFNPLFDVGGVNKGDQWIFEQITVMGFQYDDKIEFLNEGRDGHRGDMALDMIDIQGGACNACSLNNGGCDMHCVPDGEGTRCECDVGYHLGGDDVRCFDDTECDANGGRGDCSDMCANTPGSYTCSCPTGYELEADGRTCRDDNECAANGGHGDCSNTCDNTLGSYTCSCPTGYELEADGRTCQDINECVPNGGKGDCGYQCENTPGTYRCDCDSGYTLNGDQKSCDDINECGANGGKGPCEVTCDNNVGSYTCSCLDGQYLQNDGKKCADVTPPPTTTTTPTTTTPPPNECLADHECDQLCHNTHEGYFCSCRDSFLLADDKRHCIDCRDVYLKQLDASQAFTSLCPTIETYFNVPLATCLINACADNVSVITYASNVCTLKLCTGGDLQVERAPNSNGWNIYVLNTTWTGPKPDDASSFPLWQLLTCVFVGAAALGVIIAVVTVCTRKRMASGEVEGRTPNENAEARHETTAENTERQPEGGVYDEVFAPDVQKTRGPNDVMVYNNTAFHGDGPYQELGPTDQRTSTAYQGIN